MALTEEQKAQMEANRQKALAKRNLALARTTTTPTSSVPVTPKSTSFTPPATSSSSSNFYGKPPAAKRVKLSGQSVLTTPKRFLINVGYNDQVISLIRSTKSAQYHAQDRVWSCDLSDHETLMKKLETLKPDVTIDPLPKWILKCFLKNQAKNEESQTPDDFPNLVEPRLYNSLMPFQREGVEFAIKHEGRVLIADDMGLGKTIQALGVASYYRSQWPVLIVCPSSMRFSWKDAIQRWFMSVSEYEISVVTSGKDFISDGYKIIIISYDLLSKKEAELVHKNFQVAIVDESHFLKNHKSNRFQAAEKILKNTERIVLLSGTPALSRPIELYSQISIICPKLFTYPTHYGMRYCDGKKISFGFRGSHYDFSGSSNMEELKLLLQETCMIRRLKSQVLSQLPSKQREMIILDPSLVKTKSKEMDERAKKMGLKSLSSTERRGVLLEWFNLTATSKAKAVLEYIKDLLEADRKFICFAHHQVMLNQIAELLVKQKVRYIRIDGNTSSELRNAHCAQFQSDDKTKVALLSITAANTGLTLTAAQLVVFAELFWNPGVLTQAEDRAHRIGQTDSVMVKYLVAKGTADDELWPLLQKKLDVLNKAGLSKDNFEDSEATNHESKEKNEKNKKITDYFSNSFLEGLDMTEWDDDSFGTT